MTIQYPGPLDKSREVYIAMDNTSNKNYTIYNTILNKLRSNGITNLHTFDVGPNHLYGAMKTVYNQGKTNAIIVYVANGIDPTNVKELGFPNPNGNDPNTNHLWGNDNRGRATRQRGNDAVIALFYDSCDPTRPSGTCYNSIVTRNPRTDVTDGGRWPDGEKPLDWMKRNKIYIVNRSSNQHNKNNSSFDYDSVKDYTGEKIGQAIADLFTYGQPDETGATPNANTNTPTVTPTIAPTTIGNTEKVIATKTISQTYSHPHYERVYKLKTDKNGAFQILHTLPYKAEYSITMKYGGDKTHNGTTRTIKVQNYAKNAQVFEEKLLYTETTIKYTDNTTDTTSTGAKPSTKHWRKVVTTENYENGVIKNKTTKTLYGDLVLQEAEKQADITIPVDTTTPIDITNPTLVNPSEMASPFNKQIPTMANGIPNVLYMTEGGKNFVMVSEKTYTLSEEQYRGVFQRDSKMMQLHDYYVPKYIAFESTDTQTWNVVKREVWNAIEESVMYYMVGRGGCAWPKTITVDFAQHKTSFPKNGSYEAVTINWKAASCQYHYVTDHQNWDDTCGDTSGSVCTQLLHNYISEQKFVGEVGHYISPDSIAKVLGKYNMGGTVTGGNRDTAAAWVKGRKPFVWHCTDHYLVITDINDEGTRIRIANSAYGLSGIPSADTKGWGLTSNWHGLYETGYRMYNYGNGSHVKAYCNWSISDSEKTRLKNFFVSMGGQWKRDNTLKQSEAVRRQ